MGDRHDGRMTRRGFLGFSAALGAGLPFAAHALSIEEAPAAIDEILTAACLARSHHAQIRAALIAELDRRGFPPAEAEAIVGTMDCPQCGCRIGLARDDITTDLDRL